MLNDSASVSVSLEEAWIIIRKVPLDPVLAVYKTLSVSASLLTFSWCVRLAFHQEAAQ